jgi:hypothetical protein
MARFGSNMKMSVDGAHRESMRRVMEGVLGCQRQSPNDTIDLFGFDDGASVAVDYVNADAVLTAEEHKASGTWIELAVDDADGDAAALEADPDVRSFSFVTGHRYFQLPGGQVFRLQA